MKSLIGSLIGLVLSVSVGAEPLLEGRVRLSSGQPVADVQVRLFDLTDLRRFVGTTTDAAGYFALSLQTFSTARSTALPTDFALGHNYPNPFNPSTIIPYQLPTSGHVRLEVFNVLGQRLATLVDAEQSAGMHTAQWDGTDAAGRAVGAGVYIYRLSSGGMTESRRMVLVDGQAGIPAVALGPVQSAEEETAATDLPVYGLTVSGEGLVAYVDPAFRVGVDEADIVLKEHSGSPRMKLAAGGLLGDVNNDGQVDAFDALYVLLYSEDSSITLPNNGDISLGDVNGDGQVNLADAVLLATYSVNPSDPSLPPGIGQAAPEEPSVGETSVDLDTAFSHIYWRDSGTGKIQRASLDGSNIEDLVAIEGSSVYGPHGLALDVNGGKIYWTTNDFTHGKDKIQRANLDGSNIETVFITDSDISYLALDINEGKLYWTDEVYDDSGADRGDKIRRANLDGSNIETLVTIDRYNDDIYGLVLDINEGKLYWTKEEPSTLEGEIWRANLDGSNIETLVTTEERKRIYNFTVAGGKIYWTEIFVSRFGSKSDIRYANLDGSNIETLVTIDNTSGLRGITLDMAGGKMYWTDFDWEYSKSGKIQRANLDGSNIETLVSGLEEPVFCALGGFYEPSNPEKAPIRSREEARSELAERSIPYSQGSFITYAQNGDLDVVRLFVEAGMDVNAQPYSSSVAHTTETKPDSSLVDVWFPQPGDEDDDTALMKAAGQGHIEVVRFLVEQGAYLNIRNRQDQDALMFAAAGGHLAVAIFLIDIAPVATAPCVVGGPQKGPNIVCKSSLLYDAGAFRSSYSSGPQSALEWAVYNGHLNMVHVLLESSLRREGFSYTVSMSLAWAAYRGHLDVGRLLLEYGAFVDIRPGILGGERGPTPLVLAAYSGQLDMVRFLLDHGADIHYRVTYIWRVTETPFGPVIDTAIGASALHMAINQGHAEVLRLLLEHWMWEYGADSRGPHGMSTLMYAAAAGDLEMARLMLENGAPVNGQTDVGTTALMFAAAEGHVEVVRFLVENGADIHIQNGYNYTALSLAEERGHQEVVDFLRPVEDAG